MAELVGLETDSSELRTAFEDLGRASAGLRLALESDVSLRADPGNVTRNDLAAQSAQTVQQRRLELGSALSNHALRV